jgi:lectin-like protein
MKAWLMIAMFTLCGIDSRSQELAGPIQNPGNGHLYYLFAPTSWTAMEAQAGSLGGHLATIRNQAENDWVWSTFTALNGNNNLFIGLTDTGQEGSFFWISGEPGMFRNWRANEPNNAGGEDYVLMRAIDGQWNDVSGLMQYGVVEVIPEPSTFALLVTAGISVFSSSRKRSKQ